MGACCSWQVAAVYPVLTGKMPVALGVCRCAKAYRSLRCVCCNRQVGLLARPHSLDARFSCGSRFPRRFDSDILWLKVSRVLPSASAHFVRRQNHSRTPLDDTRY
jgi:hypothetical protein